MDNRMRFISRPGFIVRKAADEFILVPVTDGEIRLDGGEKLEDFNGMMRLNDVGLTIWERLAEPAELEELTDVVCSDYDIEREAAGADIAEFLETGIRNQVIFILAEQER